MVELGIQTGPSESFQRIVFALELREFEVSFSFVNKVHWTNGDASYHEEKPVCPKNQRLPRE